MTDDIRPLTQEQRQAARRAAHSAVTRAVGPKPVRDHFSDITISKYPTSVTRLITCLCLVLLLAAFTPSAIRLFVIGSTTFGQAVPNSVATHAVGLATVLSAEVGQVVFSLALATLGTSRSACRLLYLSMGLATAIALTGNIQIGLVKHADSPFAWLESIAPPLLVLSTAFVLKEQLLETVEHRHLIERTYQIALSEWQKATANPEAHPQWAQFYANALRDALSKVNNRRQEMLSSLTTADWRALVYRELQAEQWYVASQPNPMPVRVEDEQTPVPLAVMTRRNGHGIHAGLEGV
jgi:hypothetical protein